MNNVVEYLKKYKSQALAFVFLGYAPFLGESFRFYFLPISGFIVFAFLFTLLNLKEFKQFLLEKNSPQFWWMLIILYCLLNTSIQWGKGAPYLVYLDLGSCFVMLFGLFFGKYLSYRISLDKLFATLVFILLLLFGKTLIILLYKIPVLFDGFGFLIGSANFGSIPPRIILRGENPFLISIFLLAIGYGVLQKNSLIKNIFIGLILVVATVLILISGWRSIYVAVSFGVIILITLSIKKISPRKGIGIALVLIIFLASFYLIANRDTLNVKLSENYLQSLLSTIRLNSSSTSTLNINFTEVFTNPKLALNSQSYALKIAEYVHVINLVGGGWLFGLGMGVPYISPGLDIGSGSYVHSHFFWLYLKGGVVLVSLFYAFIAYCGLKKYQYFASQPYNQSIILSLVITISFCVMDLLTNQFPTLAGAFYLGFWITYMTNQSSNQIRHDTT